MSIHDQPLIQVLIVGCGVWKRDVTCFRSPLNGTFKIRFDIGTRCRESHKRQREFLMTLILGSHFLSTMGACYMTRVNVSFSGEPEAHV